MANASNNNERGEHDAVVPAPATAPLSPPTARSLVLLSAKAVALSRPLEEIAACLDFFPRTIRRELLAHLSHERLRGLEVRWNHERPLPRTIAVAGDDDDDGGSGNNDWSLEKETECEWRKRSKSVGAVESHGGAPRKRSFRQAFWEHRFRTLLRSRVSLDPSYKESNSGADNAVLSAPAVDDGSSHDEHGGGKYDAAALHLFHDVVYDLKVHGREVVPRNVALISSLQRLQRLEVHHPEQQKTCWTSLVQLIQSHQSLTELCFFHGKLDDSQLQQIRVALIARAAATSTTATHEAGGAPATITKFELVSMKIRNRGYRELTSLLSECQQLTDIRLSSCIADFENDQLVANLLSLPRLKSLSLEHNDLEDDAFVAIGSKKAPMSLKYLKLSSNAISVATLSGISTASLDGFLKLETLELRNNVDIGDASIHALAPMLPTSVTLTHLDLFNCNFGLEGAMNLLLALGKNKTLTSLNIGHNFFGSSFGDLLADFLVANSTLERLDINYVGLGTAGCTERLRQALISNSSLVEISIGANRLRDDGADVLFQAIVERCHRKPYALVDLSGNLLTAKGFSAIANTIERASPSDDRSEAREYEEGVHKRQKLVGSQHSNRKHSSSSPQVLMRELSLLDNNFPRDLENGDVIDMLQNRIKVVRTNTWVGKRNVYDDEV
ncbi:Leucine-rich repeat, ribonuclease inhibitor subtype [Globisporangium polare]